MKKDDPSRFKIALISASWLMTIIVCSICYLSLQPGVENNKALFLLGGGFSVGCAAIFGLLKRHG